MKQQGKIWIDGKGKEIPTYAINPVLRVEENHTQKIARVALRIEKSLQELEELSAIAHKEVYDAKVKDANIKGNKTPSEGMTLNSFDNTIEVKITRPDSLYFDNTMTELVKQKFSEYFESLNAGNETALFLKDLVNDLMYTSGGNLDNSKVLKLRKYRDRMDSSDKLKKTGSLFIEAVDLFDKAIRTKPGNPGLYVSISDMPGEKKRKVALKFTDI